MGLLSDFLRFVGSVVLGRKDAGREFREALSMGERYLRWGEERQDIRDYAAANEQFDRCDDHDAPRPDLVVRKYMGLVNAAVGVVELHMRKYREERGKARKAMEELVREAKTLAGQIEVSRERVKNLKEEGSLIKAKDEERRLDELRMRHAAATAQLQSGEFQERAATSYDTLAAEVERVCQDLELRMVNLEALPNMAPAAVSSLREQANKRVDALRGALRELKPGGGDEPGATPAGAPAAGEGPGREEQDGAGRE